MFGNNPKRPLIKGDGAQLFVQSIFKTLQAEGPFAGIPAIFIRLGGCNLACDFCDTEFESFSPILLEEVINRVLDLSKNSARNQSVFLVVITGGEPLRQPIKLLCQKLLELDYKVQIETNGTLCQDLPDAVEIVCSPKVSAGKYYRINQDLLPKISALKYLISANVPGYSEVPKFGKVDYKIPIFVQSMDEYDTDKNEKNKKLAVSIALENGYRLSYQIHKELTIE